MVEHYLSDGGRLRVSRNARIFTQGSASPRSSHQNNELACDPALVLLTGEGGLEKAPGGGFSIVVSGGRQRIVPSDRPGPVEEVRRLPSDNFVNFFKASSEALAAKVT